MILNLVSDVSIMGYVSPIKKRRRRKLNSWCPHQKLSDALAYELGASVAKSKAIRASNRPPEPEGVEEGGSASKAQAGGVGEGQLVRVIAPKR